MQRSYGREERRPPKEGPNFEASGKLYEENKRHGKTLKHAEPADAVMPEQKLRFHVFKGDDQVEVIKLWGQSCFLFGRDQDIVDVFTAHESCSKQHAVVQFRKVTKDLGFGNYQVAVKPYLMDLESANGTFLNEKRLEACRYYELLEKDLVKFGASTREYILMPYNI